MDHLIYYLMAILAKADILNLMRIIHPPLFLNSPELFHPANKVAAIYLSTPILIFSTPFPLGIAHKA
jgi:hypothetical protein